VKRKYYFLRSFVFKIIHSFTLRLFVWSHNDLLKRHGLLNKFLLLIKDINTFLYCDLHPKKYKIGDEVYYFNYEGKLISCKVVCVSEESITTLSEGDMTSIWDKRTLIINEELTKRKRNEQSYLLDKQ